MSITSNSVTTRLRYHPNAYQFVFASLRYTQQQLDRDMDGESDEQDAHISGPELLAGICEMAIEKFGLMTLTVFHRWGIQSTADFGRIVFELIERGEMRKTDRDQLSDFFEVYDFEEEFDQNYHIDTKSAFRN